MRYNCRSLRKLASRNYDKAWEVSGKLIQPCLLGNARYKASTHGKKNILFETVNKLRNVYDDLGFIEVILPMTISEEDIRKQMGPETDFFVTIVYSLASTDINVQTRKDLAIPQGLLRKFEKGLISGDSILGEIAQELHISRLEAARRLKEASEKRSCTVGSSLLKVDGLSWLPFLNKKILSCVHCNSFHEAPLKMFNIDRSFRREKIVDELHLMSFHTCQSVIVDENVSISIGKDIARRVLGDFDIRKVRFAIDKKESMYYAPKTQYEIFAQSDNLQRWTEVGTIGIFSPLACAEYSIDRPVLNVGMCVERLVMTLEGGVPTSC